MRDVLKGPYHEPKSFAQTLAGDRIIRQCVE
jgi:hypothetical protein